MPSMATIIRLSGLGALLLVAGTPFPGHGVNTSDRITVLEEYHGFFPCSDCHADQETDPTPRFLEDDHVEPLEWEDDAGEAWEVEFGEYLAVGDLLKGNGIPGLRGENLARIGRRLGVVQWIDDTGADPADSLWVLTHGGANIWCLDCHDPGDRDRLRKMNGDLLTFNESHLLCGQCHGPELLDWEHGVHGRTNGYWNIALDEDEITTRLLCVECHIPHAPAFRGMAPEAAPRTRIDNITTIDPDFELPHEEKGRGDDLGPHSWERDDATASEWELH